MGFIKGILANMYENNLWTYNSGIWDSSISHLICPVVWCSWGGWILIMRKAAPLTKQQYYESDISEHERYFPGDAGPSNYGLLDGRIVKIDYGN